MNKIIIIEPPKNCWSNGYVVYKGNNESSLNKTTLYSSRHKIIPNQERLRQSFDKLKQTLKLAGFDLVVLNFPEELNKPNSLHHDAVFIRDVGLMLKNYWIKANFSAIGRQPEAEIYAEIIKKKFQKEVISLPKNAFLEFGETIYLQTAEGSFYFGGVSRANREGHDFVRNLLKPDHYFLIKSKGFHLDTIFAPVINKANKLVGLIIARDMVDRDSFNNLKNLGIEILTINKKDSSDEDGRGNYAVNSLVGAGVIISGSAFTTPNVQEKLKELGVKFYVVPLPDFNATGGSVHCLTNEIYK